MWRLAPTAQLYAERDRRGAEVQVDRLNVQHQDEINWEPTFAVVRSFVDQLVRAEDIDAKTLGQVNKFVDRAERFSKGHQTAAARAQLRAIAGQLEGDEFDALRGALLDLADSLP